MLQNAEENAAVRLDCLLDWISLCKYDTTNRSDKTRTRSFS